MLKCALNYVVISIFALAFIVVICNSEPRKYRTEIHEMQMLDVKAIGVISEQGAWAFVAKDLTTGKIRLGRTNELPPPVGTVYKKELRIQIN